MKLINTLILILTLGILFAEPTFVPTTTLAEDFGATWCDGCTFAWEGLQVLHSDAHNGEFISARLYTESADLSSPLIQDRFNYYEVIGIPAVIMNGKIRIEGSGDGIADGSLYNAALNKFRYSSAPVSIAISSFNATAGTFAGSVNMVSPTENIQNAKVVYYLLENDVSTEDTHVLRSILYDDINLSGAGSSFPFSKTFSLNPAWNTANLWAIATVQLANKTILQSASTLPQPTYNFRAAMDWNPNIEGAANISYQSSPLWFFNLGAADSYTVRIEIDYSPDDWYFNFCDEDGNCYPGSVALPFSLGAGDKASYHLNLWIGSPGIAYFRFVVNSANLGEYSIPFRYKVEGVANNDETQSPVAMQINSLHPNPVSVRATFNVSSPKSGGLANIEIFNLKGQKVQTVQADQLTAGQNSISFSPAANLPNGVYLYRLQGSAKQAGKFILSK